MNPTEYVQKILASLGVEAKINDDHFVSNQVETLPVDIHGVSVKVQYTRYANGGIGAEVTFSLPDEGVLADTYIRHVAKKENLKKNHGHEYHVGPDYRDYASSLLKKDTIAYSPWNDHYLVVASKYYRDRNSFFHGWFSPFNDRGRGTFDTLWPSSVDYAAKGMGNEGTFEYAVACILLEDKDFIAKGRQACRIREERIVEKW